MIKNSKILFFTICIQLFFVQNILGQFNVTGSAVQNCHEFNITNAITPSVYQRGGFFNNTQIDLTTGFDMLFSVKFGCDNIGGEGLAFVLQHAPNQSLGVNYDMGFGNPPTTGQSIAIEFDTRNNDAVTGTGEVANQDPVYDHIDVMRNGNVNHTAPHGLLTVQDGAPAVAGNGNIEDCEYHLVRIVYDHGATELSVYFDNVIVGTSTPTFTLNIDLTNSLMLGTNLAYWGWTGTTGDQPGNTNHQVVKLALEPSFTASGAVCPGTPVNFVGSSESYNPVVTYEWDFNNDNVIDATGQNASYTFPAPGDYEVAMEITDNQGCVSRDTLIYSIGFDVTIDANPTDVCPGGTSQLEAITDPFVSQECEFVLTWGDTWGDGWDGNEIELIIDGVTEGTYTMLDIGTPSSNSINLMIQHGADVEICYHQTNDATAEGEIYFNLEDVGGNSIIDVAAGDIPTTTPNGASICNSAIIDCGLIPPTYDYSWSVTAGTGTLNNNTIVNPMSTNTTVASTYEVTVTDQATGCDVTESVTINITAPPTATISGNETICDGDLADLTVDFTGTGPFDIEYNDGSGNNQTITGITTNPYTLQDGDAGNYTLVSVDGPGGCAGSVSGTADVNVIPTPDVDLSPNETYCDGDPINPMTVISTNGGTVTWYTDNTLTNVLATGNSYTPTPSVGQNIYYAQEAEGIMGCVGDYDSVIITVNPIPATPTITGTTVYCEGETTTDLTANGTNTGFYSWYDGSGGNLSNGPTQDPGVLPVGNHVFQVSETINGCESLLGSITVTIKDTPPVPTMSSDVTYCQGESILDATATDNMGGMITWSSDANGTNVLGTGSNYTPSSTLGTTTYYATETLNGCTSPAGSVDITINEVPMISIPEEAEICNGDSVYIEVTNNGFPITWTSGDTGPNAWLSPSTTTTYLVTSSNNCGDDQDTITVVVYDPPTILASDDINTGLGGEVELNVNGAQSYTWAPDVTECIDDSCREVYVVPTQTTTYIVTGVDANGCIGTDTVVVTIDGEMQIFVPNIFSPNGDGWNDYMVIKGPRLFDFKLLVFDRWGKLMYEADDQKDYWDGKFNGQQADQGVYVYRITGTNVLGIDVEQKGNITIVR